MIATRTISNILGGPERSALDLPVAGLAALAVAFAAFTIPDALLGDAIVATGLPALLSAAQPPLGNTARLLMAVIGALVAFVAAFALLRWLDRFAGRPQVRVESEVPAQAPRIHRADAHPDAPPRRPISAIRDLGEPAPPSRPISAARDLGEPDPPSQPEPADEPEVDGLQPAVAAASIPPSATLTELMARLERGLARRETEAGASPAATAAPIAPPAASNDRLQSAIEGLKALSARA